MPLAEIADVEALLGDTVDDSARADLLLEMASAVVAAECRQTIAAETSHIVVLDGVWGRELVLGQRPVTAVTEVVLIDPVTDAEVTVPPSAYGWRSDGTLLLVTTVALVNAPAIFDDAPSWGGPEMSVRVTYDHGYAEIPPLVRFVTAAYTARLFAGGPLQAGGVSSETFDGSYQVSYGQASTLPADLRRLLRPLDKRLHTVDT